MKNIIKNSENKIINNANLLLNKKVNIYLYKDNDNKKGKLINVELIEIFNFFNHNSFITINDKNKIKYLQISDICKIESNKKEWLKFDWTFIKLWIKMFFTKKAFMLILFSFLFLNIKAKPENSFVKQIHEELICQNVKFTKIVIKQAILETGWFKSNVYKNKNNLFGFRTKNGYLSFDSWEDSILYYKKWQKKHYTKFKEITEDTCYYKFLEWVGYAEDELYITKLKSIKINHII